jgi:hypothetical protein
MPRRYKGSGGRRYPKTDLWAERFACGRNVTRINFQESGDLTFENISLLMQKDYPTPIIVEEATLNELGFVYAVFRTEEMKTIKEVIKDLLKLITTEDEGIFFATCLEKPRKEHYHTRFSFEDKFLRDE